MNRRRTAADPIAGLELAEEAFHLLRRAPPALWLTFFAGSVPFVLFVLFFLADRAHTGEPGVGEAFAAAVLYTTMKVGQGHFARGLRQRIAPTAERGSPARHAAVQIAAQPWSLFVLPVCFVVGLPFGWAYAYYQSLAVTGDRAAARRHAAGWQRQNHALLAYLTLFGLFAFLNALVLVIVLPDLLHTLLGLQSAGAANPFAMLSSTTLAAALALTYLAMAPLTRAAYALRCFYRDARGSADDLRGDLRAQRRALGLAAALSLTVLVVGLLAARAPASAATDPAEQAGAQSPGSPPVRADADTGSRVPRVDPRELDAALRRVLQRREFAWRLQRPAAPPQSNGWFARLLQPVIDASTRGLSSAIDGIRRLLDWIRGLRPDPAEDPADHGGFAWIGWTDALFALAACLVAIAAIALVRRLRRRPPTAPAVVGPPAAGGELALDEVAAAALPYDQWLETAQSLIARGELRGAVRAAYLAALALLAHRELLTPARFKSNREYQSEVARRTRDRPAVAALFAESVAAFERVWYGRHAVDAELAAWSLAQVERLRSHAG